MEPLLTGTIALLLFCGNKLIDWGIGKAYDAAFDKLMEKSPDTAEQLTLPPGERENIGEAVLVRMVENTALQEPELKQALEALGEEVQAMASKKTELETAFNKLAQTVKTQSPAIVNENWQGINIKGGTNTVQNNTLSFGK
ncbi:hypothetical protein CAL7716_080240 [Calothrix sp. PCC 7716]|nr:hypothetical protein CAL7716_080240 [Calothrix sp. PCC 7716]